MSGSVSGWWHVASSDDFDYFVPNDWYGAEKDLYDSLVNGDPVLGSDRTLQMLYDVALFDKDIRPDEREAIMDELVDYLWREYGLDFDDAFDWDGYRDWYEHAAG